MPACGLPARGLQLGCVLEPARPETAWRTPQGLASTTRSTKSNRRTWDFDEDEQDFGEKKNPLKPHASP
jgi:hypothetical protein